MARLCLYGTVLNSVDTVERSIRSVFRSDAEIVVVDGGSTDGTYEKLLEISRDYNMRVYRLPGSSRGMARDYALHKCPEGSYAAYFDLDDEYNEYFHRSLEWGMAQGVPNPLHYLTMREYAIARGGWRDLNFAEDVEFWVRVGFSYSIPVPTRVPIVRTRAAREARYARGLLGYAARVLRSGSDDYRGNGYTLSERFRAELRRAGPRSVVTAPVVLGQALVGWARGTYRAVGPLLNLELFDLMRVETSVGPDVVGAPARLASISLIWSLAGKVELWSVVRRASERTAVDLRPYRCTNGRYVLAASEEALRLAVSSFSVHGTSCVPVAGGPQNNNPGT